MKTLAQIQEIADLDSRVINAAALLEVEILAVEAQGDSTASLGELVQKQACFENNHFIRDVNFALGVRNSIAHWVNGVEPSLDDKKRAAEYLVKAIQLVCRSSGVRSGRAAEEAQDDDRFDLNSSLAGLKSVYRQRKIVAAFAGLLAVAVLFGLYFKLEIPIPFNWVIGGGFVLACLIFSFGFGGGIQESVYRSLPGARFSNGDHRCIYCGSRGREGRGIYTHGKYKSDTKFHECSKCKKLLYTS